MAGTARSSELVLRPPASWGMAAMAVMTTVIGRSMRSSTSCAILIVLMDADFSIELGREDPVLDFPWTDPAGKFAYVDLKRHPELMAEIEEAQRFPELAEFLLLRELGTSMLETAKCDAWATTELSPEEEIYDASHKFASYVDVVFSDIDDASIFFCSRTFCARSWLSYCDGRRWLRRQRRYACGAATSEKATIHRKAFTAPCMSVATGTMALSARQNWGVGLKSMGNAIVQISME